MNLHLKFPFSVVGGLLSVPTVEFVGSEPKSTLPLITRGIERLSRAGERRTEADATHLLEAVGVIVFDPYTGQLDPDVPPVGSGLRWEELIRTMATVYQARFL